MTDLVYPGAVVSVCEGHHHVLKDVSKPPGEDIHRAPARNLGVNPNLLHRDVRGVGHHLREGETHRGHVVCNNVQKSNQAKKYFQTVNLDVPVQLDDGDVILELAGLVVLRVDDHLDWLKVLRSD